MRCPCSFFRTQRKLRFQRIAAPEPRLPTLPSLLNGYRMRILFFSNTSYLSLKNANILILPSFYIHFSAIFVLHWPKPLFSHTDPNHLFGKYITQCLKRVMNYHPWTAEPHHLTNLIPHIRTITMNSTLVTLGLLFPELAMVKSGKRVFKQWAAIFTQRIASMLFVAP